VTLTDYTGLTALGYAENSRKRQVVDALKAAGARN
jgi:hypothetical protein